MSLVQRLAQVLRTEPALVTNMLAVAATLIAAFVTTVSQTQEAAIVTIATALVAVATGFLARPVVVPVITGAVVTGLTAAAAFGVKLSPDNLAMVATVLAFLLPSLLLRLHLTPVASSSALVKAADVYGAAVEKAGVPPTMETAKAFATGGLVSPGPNDALAKLDNSTILPKAAPRARRAAQPKPAAAKAPAVTDSPKDSPPAA